MSVWQLLVNANDQSEAEAERIRRIHRMIAAAIDAEGSDELGPIMTELRAALKDHIRRIRAMAADKLRPRF